MNLVKKDYIYVYIIIFHSNSIILQIINDLGKIKTERITVSLPL